MLHKVLMAMMASCSLVAAQTTTEQYPSAAEIAAAQASVIPYSPTSNVPGKVFNRFIDIWLENTVGILDTSLKAESFSATCCSRELMILGLGHR